MKNTKQVRKIIREAIECHRGSILSSWTDKRSKKVSDNRRVSFAVSWARPEDVVATANHFFFVAGLDNEAYYTRGKYIKCNAKIK